MKESNDITQSNVSSRPPKANRTITFSSNMILAVIAIIAFGALCFWGGTMYQKHNGRSTLATRVAGGFSGSRRFGGGVGTATQISSSSITVQNSRTGATKTYNITSSTSITDNDASVTYSDIKTGDRVIVVPSASSASDVATIIVNPNFGGFRSSNSSTNTSSTTGI